MLSASAALIHFCWNKVQCPHLAQPVPLLLVYTSSSYPVDSLWMCVCVCVCARVCVCSWKFILTLFCSLLCDGLYASIWRNST